MDRRLFLTTLGLGLTAGGLMARAQTPLTAGSPSAAPPAAAPPPVTPPGPAAPEPTQDFDDYLLGSSDKIRVIVFNEDSLGGEFFVSGDGKVSLPLIGEVQAAGRTVRAFQMDVTAKLAAGYLRDPRVSIEVLTYRPYYIFGEVNRPGEYPYSNGLTVIKAIVAAGGFTYRANEKKVFIRRANDKNEKQFKMDGVLDVQPGDTIRIVERYF